MHRLRFSLGRAALVFVSVAAAITSAAARPPDIVIVIADDQTWTDAGCYGNSEVYTPNIDRLATEGMRFTHAFTATAMCAPTRQQLYTGLFPVRNGAFPNHSRVKPGTKSIVHHLRDLGYRVGLSGKRHFGPPASFPFERVERDALASFIGKTEAPPYCLVVASNSPHLPWTAGDASRYDASALEVPPWLVDTPETRECLTRYYAEVTDFDREVGECAAIVKASGKERGTIFICTSEQGAQFPRAKWTCYDTGLRVGLIVRWPERVRPGSVSHALVQYVDIVPTLIAAAGGTPARDLDGRSFLPVLLGESQEHRDVVYGVHTTRGIINGSECYPIRSIRTRTHKLIWNLNHKTEFRNIVTTNADRSGYWDSWTKKAETDARARRFVEGYRRRPEFELYDVRRDPYELENLAADPAEAKRLADLKTRIEAFMKSQGDRGIETELEAPRGRQGVGRKASGANRKRAE